MRQRARSYGYLTTNGLHQRDSRTGGYIQILPVNPRCALCALLRSFRRLRARRRDQGFAIGGAIPTFGPAITIGAVFGGVGMVVRFRIWMAFTREFLSIDRPMGSSVGSTGQNTFTLYVHPWVRPVRSRAWENPID